MTKPKLDNPNLQSWADLNKHIMTCDEAACEELLVDELAGRKRKQFLRRIHSRMNKVRADRERAELDNGAAI